MGISNARQPASRPPTESLRPLEDIFSNYLQAALLEPILAMYGQDSIKERQIVINLLMLASIAWWTWVIKGSRDDVAYIQFSTRRRQPHAQPDTERGACL